MSIEVHEDYQPIDIKPVDQEVYEKLRFGMTKKEIDALIKRLKAKEKKPSKKWRPQNH